MSRSLRITIKILAGIIALLVLVWCAAAFYINRNNKAILSTILSQLNANVSGKITVESMETTLLKGFPGVAVSLKKVTLHDSLYTQHRHELLNAKDIDVSLNIFSLIAGDIKINKIGINRAQIYLYTDSSGYSNTSMFKPKAKTPASKTSNDNNFQVKRIDFSEVKLIIDNERRFKRFDFDVKEIKGHINYPDSGWVGSLKVNTHINSFAFNTRKGSFLKDKSLTGTLKAFYSSDKKIVTVTPEPLNIGGDKFIIGASINLAKNDAAFSVDIRADRILYRNISNLLAPNIAQKLEKFAIEEPIGVVGQIIDDGQKNGTDPFINVRMNVKNNRVNFPSGELNNCEFTGTFTNKRQPFLPISDENSTITFYNLKADYYNAPITVDTFTISNLARPIASGLVSSSFPLSRLNESLGGDLLQFKKGTAELKLYCKTDIENFLFTKPIITGKIEVKDADIAYLPRKMNLTNSRFTLQFNQKDLSISNSRFQLGKSIVNVNCSIANFLNFYYTDPEKIEAKLSLSSPQLNLGEFIGFLSSRKPVKRTSNQKNAIRSASEQLSTVLEASKVQLNLRVNRATYERFIANNLSADVSLVGNGIYINQFRVNHAGGALNLNGKLIQNANLNKFQIQSTVSKVNVKEFFYAFENFGQDAITNQNIQGFLSAKIDASGSITEGGSMVKRSMYGQVIFNLQKAALINFEPINKVGKFAFPNRDLKHIAIENLDGTLTLKGDQIYIGPMQVNSSALNFDVKGVYGITRGTDIALDIPLRNPKKDEKLNSQAEREQARMKGIVLHLKAVDNGTGGLKVKWNKDHNKQ